MARPPRNPRPLDAARLEELALAYAARFATSAARLEAYLRRKLRERGWAGAAGEGAGEEAAAALAARFVAAGYVDDAAFAAARTGSMLRRGYGARRIDLALGAAGIDEGLRLAARAGAADQRRAALALAKRRGFGPFGSPLGRSPADRARREKQLAAMLRAGHPLDSARVLVDAADVDAALAWAEGWDGDD